MPFTGKFVAATGALVSANVSKSAFVESCETSIRIPFSFSLATACLPKSERPPISSGLSPKPLTGSDESSQSLLPAWLKPNIQRAVVPCVDLRKIFAQGEGVQKADNNRKFPLFGQTPHVAGEYASAAWLGFLFATLTMVWYFASASACAFV